jgi:DNA-directed RNA polymerase subunit RPC12/RpoP
MKITKILYVQIAMMFFFLKMSSIVIKTWCTVSKRREIIVQSAKCRTLKYTSVKRVNISAINAKMFSSKRHLIGHIKTEHEKQFDFECSTCGKKVASNTKLLNHILQCHSQVKCEICNKEIANPYDLKRHKLAVHKDTTGVWLCGSCPKSVFFNKSKFDKHMKDKHGQLGT